MKSTIFLHNNLQREYQVLGNGSRILYAFHGFGRSAVEWEAFLPWLEREFTIYCFADFFHGESKFPEDRLPSSPLRTEEIESFFKAFANEQNHGVINLMAYSSGGRTLLSILEKQALVIEEVWLFAPDGVEISFWNHLFGKYKWARNIFKLIIQKPDLFLSLVRSLNKLGLLNKSLTYFVLANMRDEKKRNNVYNFWLLYQAFIPDIKEVISKINENEIRFHLIFGEEDKVIPPVIGRRMIKKLGNSASLTELKGGHLLVDKKHLDYLMKEFPLK